MILLVHYSLLLSALTAVQATCPDHWNEWQGHCYKVTGSPNSWHGVRTSCKSQFRLADVASITSKAEHDFIMRELVGSYPYLWLGMRSHKGRRWWVDNSPVTFKNFKLKPTHLTTGTNDVVRMVVAGTGFWELVSSYTSGTSMHGICKMASCQCPRGWTWMKENNRCYKAEKSRIGWVEARQQCQRMAPNADLVTIHNAKENALVVRLAAGNYPSWIGLTDREKEGVFRWSGGTRISAAYNWGPGEGPGKNTGWNDCFYINQDGTWSVKGCHTLLLKYRSNGFVCEQLMCGRDRGIPADRRKIGTHHIWNPENGVRCPDDWTRSGDKCISKTTAADTFIGVHSLCTKQHPQARIAIVSSLEENDMVFHEVDTLPVWIRHSPDTDTDPSGFTNWQQDSPGNAVCASMQDSGLWLAESCGKVRPGLCQVPACVPKCPSNWTLFEGRCYRVHDETKVNPLDAEAACQRTGGHLASIQSQAENDFISTLAYPGSRADYFVSSKYLQLTIGATAAANESFWSWNDCADWTMPAAWAKSGIRKGGKGHTQNMCAVMGAYDGRVDRRSCTQKQALYVCKLDPCGKQFGPLDRSSCNSVKLTTTTPPPTILKTDHIPDNQHTTVQSTGCPDDGKVWLEDDGVCTTFFPSNIFKEAFFTCKHMSKNGFIVTLPVIKLANRKAVLMKLTNDENHVGDVWLGLTKRWTGFWYWHDVTRAGALDWQVEPEPGMTTRCASMDEKTGGLVARDCSEKLPFFCEARRMT